MKNYKREKYLNELIRTKQISEQAIRMIETSDENGLNGLGIMSDSTIEYIEAIADMVNSVSE